MTTTKPTKRKKSQPKSIRPSKAPKIDLTKNRHHFTSFPVEASRLNLNPVFSALREVWADPESPTTSLFHSRMVHWSDLNLTEGFGAFSRLVNSFSSLPLVIHNREKIWGHFKDCILKSDELCLESLFDVLAAFALDLQHDFRPYYTDFVELVAHSSKLKNAPVLKASFDSLNQVIKMLLRSATSSSELLEKTLLLLNLGVPLVAQRLCAGSIAQILRKSIEELPQCISMIVTVGCEVDLVPLAGLILVQSVKTTSKSLVTNVSKVLEEMLRALDVSEIIESQYETLVEAILTNLDGLSTMDIEKILKTVLSYWTNTSSHEKYTNSKLDLLTKIIKLSRGKKIDSIESETAKLLLQYLDMKSADLEKLAQVSKMGRKNLKIRNRIIGKSREEGWLIIRKIIGSDSSGDSKAFLLNAISELQDFEGTYLHRVVQYLEAHQSKDESLMLTVESLWKFAEKKIACRDDTFFAIEFPCVNPNDLTTIPNSILLKLEENFKIAGGCQNEYVRKSLPLLVLLRPLNVAVAIEVFKKVLRGLSRNAERIDSLNFAIKALGELTCPHEFFEFIMQWDIINLLTNEKTNPFSVRALDYLFSIMSTLNEKSWMKEDQRLSIATGIIKRIHLANHDDRLDMVSCLKNLFPGKENFANMLNAEKTAATVQSYREKLKFLSCLSYNVDNSDHFIAECNLRYLLSAFSVNFSLLWDPSIKIVETFWDNFDKEKCWLIFYDVFKAINQMASEENTPGSGIDYKNCRNLLLQSLDGFITYAERKNSLLAIEFLDVFLKDSSAVKDQKGLSSFIKVYKKFSNLKSVTRFEDVKKMAERCLGDKFLKNREIAVDFFVAAFRDLRVHQTLLNDLVDDRKWKAIFLAFPVEILGQSETFCELLILIMVGKVRQTAKEKRADQLASRKSIVRSIFMLGNKFGEEFLRLLIRQQVPYVFESDCSIDPTSIYEQCSKLDMVFDILLLSANSAICVTGGTLDVAKDILRILRYQGKLMMQKNAPKKRRPKLLEEIIQMFKALQAWEWSPEDEKSIFIDCIWPLLQPDEYVESEEKLGRICYLAKIVTLFNLWMSLDQYQHWFFIENSCGETATDWICTVFESPKAAEDFKEKLLTSSCQLLVQNTEEKKGHLKEKFLTCVLSEFVNSSLQKRKVRTPKPMQAQRLNGLAALLKIIPLNIEINENVLYNFVISAAVRSKGEIQTASIQVLHRLISRRKGGPPPASAFKLLSVVVQDDDNKQSVRKMLWKNIENYGMPLNDKLIDGGEYKKMLQSPEGLKEDQFLFLLHYCASEIYAKDYTKRSTAGTCIRDMIHVLKQQKSPKDYLSHLDSALLPVISKGLQSKSERVQSEFIEILLESATEEGFIGSKINISQLINQTDDPELNFFDNMKHIQKHRRGRALRRLAKRIESEPDFLSTKCLFEVVYPMTCSYLFNSDYTKHSDTILAAIGCLGALCSRFNWKDYKWVLLHFLKVKPTESAHQKQRVKILSAILNSFHFASSDKSKPESSAQASATEIVDSLLRKVRLQQDDELDVALYVPILKILLLYPEKLNSNISTLFVQVARKLRNRFIEDRKLARDILSEMCTLLGPKYFSFLLSVLEGTLQRGYQVHILVYTISTVMTAMESQAYPGCYDTSIPKIIGFVGKELFGELKEEKKIAAIVSKTPEAAKTVSFLLLENLATLVSKSVVCDLLTKLFEVFSTSKATFELVEKLRKAVKAVQTGLNRNKALEKPTDFLHLSFGIFSGKLFSPEIMNCHSSVLKEFAFTMMFTGTNSGQVNGVQLKPFWPYFRDSLDHKDVNVVVSCLKFLASATHSKDVCEVLIDSDARDFVGVISTKCKVFHGMKNRQPYMHMSVVLRNLISHGEQFEVDHLKAICLFFEGCLQSNKEDSNAMKLLGLILFRFYSPGAYGPYLQILCKNSIQCKSEVSFNVAKSILIKICQKHIASFHPAINFFIANINYEEELGRRRALIILNGMFESCSKFAEEFEPQGLFVEVATRLFNEYSNECKTLLEKLLTTILKIQAQKNQKNGPRKPNMIQDLIMKWCCSAKPMHLGIGFKLMELNIKACQASESVLKCLSKAVENVGQCLNENWGCESALHSFALAHVLELFKTCLEFNSCRSVILRKELVDSEKLCGLVLHQNSSIRRSAVSFFQSLIKLSIDECSPTREPYSETMFSKWMPTETLRTLVSNLCELGKTVPFVELLPCLVSIYVLSRKGSIQELKARFLFRKARSIFIHEKFNLPREWDRRKLYYLWAKDVCEIADTSDDAQEYEMVDLIANYLVKDARQRRLEDSVNDVQAIIEKLSRRRNF